MPCDCNACEYCEDVNRIEGQMELTGECKQAIERRRMGMEEIQVPLYKREKLKHDTQGVSIGSAFDHVAWFLQHDRDDIIDNLKQAANECSPV